MIADLQKLHQDKQERLANKRYEDLEAMDKQIESLEAEIEELPREVHRVNKWVEKEIPTNNVLQYTMMR